MLRYGQTTMLFGGDLNAPAQQFLLAAYGDPDVFRADVNKACHHGSADYELDYLKAVRPHASIFSSGDSGNYDHPLPDAIGTASRHSRGDYPLVFSTELIREGQILGHVNVRSNGTEIVVAQKKEKPSASSSWHDYVVPYPGPFA
jgi:beta-lactamase superfamily II metal-dependent hydrolase